MEQIEILNQQHYMIRLFQYYSLHFNPLQGRGHFTSKVMINRLTNKFEKQLGHKIDHW